MRDAAASWRRVAAAGHELGFGVGIAQGVATLGRIGFEDRYDYAAIGSVANLAARLCAKAKDGHILMSRQANGLSPAGSRPSRWRALQVKGLAQAVQIHDVQGLQVDRRRSDEPKIAAVMVHEMNSTDFKIDRNYKSEYEPAGRLTVAGCVANARTTDAWGAANALLPDPPALPATR